MSPNLTLRNFLPDNLLVEIQVRIDPEVSVSAFTRLQRNLTGRSPPKETRASTSIKHDPIRVHGYTCRETSIDIQAHTANQHVTVTIRNENDKDHDAFTASLPQSTPAHTSSWLSASLTPEASITSPGNLHCIYLPASSVLAIYPAIDGRSWMRTIPDDTLLSQISMPGSHNAVTYHHALPSVRCQSASVSEQLSHGFRFLDVRLQVHKPDSSSAAGGRSSNSSNHASSNLTFVHGSFPISLGFKKHLTDLLATLYDFLSTYPSETVILCCKREGWGDGTDQDLSLHLMRHVASARENWYTDPRVPRLSEVRGKIVLMRRFEVAESICNERALAAVAANQDPLFSPIASRGVEGWGLDATGWAYNVAHQVCGHVCVQDVCELPSRDRIEDKVKVCIEHIDRAVQSVKAQQGLRVGTPQSGRSSHLFLNFLSASNFFSRSCWPENVAKRLNPAIVEHLCTMSSAAEKADTASPKPHYTIKIDDRRCLGILVCDWVGRHGNWDLAKCIVASNGSLLHGS